jgi:PAS domain S-box-containing protein
MNDQADTRSEALEPDRKGTESALDVVDALCDHVCVLDADGRIVSVNRAWRDFAIANFARPATADVGTNYFAVCEQVVGDDAAMAREALRGLRAVIDGSNEEFTLEYPCHSPETKRWFELRATKVRDSTPPRLVLIHRNITHRTLGRQALSLQQEVLQRMSEGVCLVRASDLVILTANERLEQMFGYGRGELEGASVGRLECTPSVTFGEVVRRVGELIDRSGEATYEAECTRADGTHFWCRIRTSCFEHPEHGLVRISVHDDISEARRTEQALRDSEERYRSLIETSLDAVLLTTLNGRILGANPAACRMFGCSESDLQQLGRAGVVDSGDPHFSAAVEQRDRTGGFKGVLTFLHADGTRFAGELSTAVFRSTSGDLRTSMVIRDITARRRAEGRLAHAHDTLRGLAARLQAVREEERTNLARRLHEDLGHALTDLKLDLAWVDRRLEQAGMSARTAGRRRLNAASSHIDQMAQAVRGMATELRPAILDALGLKAAVTWQVREFSRRTSTDCALDLPDTLPPLTPDQSTSLFRVVQELLTNITRHASATHVQLAVTSGEGWLTIRVEDNGRGFDASQPTGPDSLGLVGIDERATTLGGRVVIDSAAAGGTRVTVSIPVPTP